MPVNALPLRTMADAPVDNSGPLSTAILSRRDMESSGLEHPPSISASAQKRQGLTSGCDKKLT